MNIWKMASEYLADQAKLQDVADGANVHGFGRFEFADGFGDQLRDHAGPAARDVTHQSSI